MCLMLQPLIGSPPQVRGKQFGKLIKINGIRITPAGAGKTGTLLDTFFAEQDHPRRCGENKACNSEIILSMWITPAGAGKTYQCFAFCACCNGSPPQVRGKPLQNRMKRSPPGITPAGAGKTRFQPPY